MQLRAKPLQPFMNHHHQVSGSLRSASPLPILAFFTMATTPTLPGCLEPTNFWIWDYHNGPVDNRTVLGGPSQTSDCFPPSWAATGLYSGTRTDLVANTITVGAVSEEPTLHLFALAMVYVTPVRYHSPCRPVWAC
jgi:hypothetical protein